MTVSQISLSRRRFASGFRGILGLAIAFLTVGPAAAQSPIGKIDNVVVSEAGQGPGQNGCASFRPTADEVRRFFERSIVISGRQNHDFFDHGPCYARGTLTTDFDVWQWQMRDLGTGRLQATNDDVFIVGDPAKQIKLEDYDR
jgi:hypothetical protein